MTPEELLTHAKAMRSEMTPAEARLWYDLRAKRLGGVKFVRQSVRRPFIPDFIARSRRLVIEVDGDTHGSTQAYDAKRTAALEAQCYRVLRFSNAEVLGNDEAVLGAIYQALGLPLSPTLSPEGRGSSASLHQLIPCFPRQ